MKDKQLEEKIDQLQAQVNSEGLDDFLGLSPSQMHLLMYGEFDEIEPILCFNYIFDRGLLANVPVVNKVNLLIRLIGEVREAKATQNGYLPKKIVNALYDSPFTDRPFTVATEEYAPDILALRYAVTDCGWLKKKNRKFSLTKKGQQILERGFAPEDYVTLLKYWLKKYNWSFTDSRPECSIVQQASIFSLYILCRKAKELFPTAQFAQLFIKAFPMALEMLPEEKHLLKSAEESLADIIRLRFLDRFVSYFGLAEYVVDESLPYLERNKKSQVKLSNLFSEVLCWFAPDKQQTKQIFDAAGNDFLH